ncbi:DUF1134 domain-containing protein [Methylocapsa polymorpha]|uniref:DUF1134 domain-containing protein n=1 Tax=Methylocapsa polymorpha TaxID=3080828 RepID=A0ABZ0HQG0_9HYPH|nr:DUF1134 domain-containing protein [Methylocapsa sp. RX1]
MQTRRELTLQLAALAAGISGLTVNMSAALANAQPGRPDDYSPDEIMGNGHRFFGSISRGLADVVENATKQWGRPNGYILGQEATGAFIGGLRYGEGVMHTRNAGDLRVFWQGPSLGLDAGADGDRTMMLVYNLPATEAIFRRYGGVDGSAYIVGGFAMTALVNDNVYVVPIRSGIGVRLGFNVSYLKFTPASTWNPF